MENNPLLQPRFLERLPLFPLPRVVFFPHTLLPLHVFEARYRELTRWCLDNDWPMAVPLIQPGHENEQPGDPPIMEVAGVGRIVRHEELPDGRFNIILEGLCRVHLAPEHQQQGLYRVARATIIANASQAEQAGLDQRVAVVHGCLAQLGYRVPALARVLTSPLLSVWRPDELADRLCAVLFHSHTERQGLLECISPADRLDRVIDRLSGLLAGTLGSDDLPQ